MEKREPQENTTRKYLSYFAILVAVLFYKGGEVFYGQSKEQYIYRRFQKEIPATPVSNENNSISRDCPGNSSGNAGNEDEVQKLTSEWEMYMTLVTFGIAFFTTTGFGVLSDFVGRKLIIIIAVLGYAIQALVAALIVNLELDIFYFLLAHAFDGFGGTQYTFSVAWYGIIADVLPVGSKRSFFLALFEAASGLARFLVKFGSGYFIHRTGFFFPIMTSAITCFCSVLLFCLALPETRKRDKNRQISPKALCKKFTMFYADKSTFISRKLFWIIQFTTFLLFLPNMSIITLTVLPQLGSPFCWSSKQIGWYGSLNEFLNYIAGLLLIRPMQNCMKDDTIAVLGIISQIGFYVIFALSQNDAMMYIAAGVGLISAVQYPLLRGMASNMVTPEKQGTLFASLFTTQLVCRLLSSSIFNNIYAQTVSYMRGTAMLAMAGVTFIALFFTGYLSYNLRHRKRNLEEPVNQSVTMEQENAQ